MSSTASTLISTFGMTDFLLPMVLEDLSDDDARGRSRDGDGPSIAWAVGHLLGYRYYMLGLLGDERENPHGDTFGQTASDGADYPSVDELEQEWAQVASDFRDALMSKSEDEWDAPGDGAHDERSLRDQITFFAWHEGYHMGAIGARLKELGYMGPAEKVMAAREAEG